MKVTKLVYQKRDPNRVNLYLDYQFFSGLNANDVLNFNLFVGKELSNEQAEDIKKVDKVGVLFNFALNFLSFRPRSQSEVRDHLITKIKKDNKLSSLSPDEEILLNSVIQKLIDLKYLNDTEFTKWFIDQRNTFKPKGQRALKFELSQKGIDPQIIKTTLIGITDASPTNSQDLIAKILAPKISRLKQNIVNYPSYLKARQKLERLLISRGFNWDDISKAVAKYLPKEYNKPG